MSEKVRDMRAPKLRDSPRVVRSYPSDLLYRVINWHIKDPGIKGPDKGPIVPT